jgi:hypothetical protein
MMIISYQIFTKKIKNGERISFRYQLAGKERRATSTSFLQQSIGISGMVKYMSFAKFIAVLSLRGKAI